MVGIGVPRWHDIEALVALLPKSLPFWNRLDRLDRLTIYATVYRYPLDDMDVPAVPSSEEVGLWLVELEEIEAAVSQVLELEP